MSGVGDIQGQTLLTGNEAGFWATGTGSNTQIANWGDGSPNSIAAAFNPNAQFHVHTHTSNGSVPSVQDMLASAMLGGMPGMVVSGDGSTAYNFQVQGGFLPTPDGMVVFEQSFSVGAGGFSFGGGVNANSDGSTTAAASVGYPGGGGTMSLNSGVELSAAAFRAGLTGVSLVGLAAGPYGFVAAEISAQVISNEFRDAAYDSRVTHSIETSRALGTYGGPDPSRGYANDGSVGYGGIDGNTAPDGSAINGID